MSALLLLMLATMLLGSPGAQVVELSVAKLLAQHAAMSTLGVLTLLASVGWLSYRYFRRLET